MFIAIWYNLWKLGNFFPRFGMLKQEKSGNPDRKVEDKERARGKRVTFES
jgi:hypothetical protein